MKFTNEEKRAIKKAMQYIATGKDLFSCGALKLAGAGHLRSQYGSLFSKDTTQFWWPPMGYASERQIALALFLIAGEDVL